MRIDIVIPYYGPPGLMRATVESVLSQTDPDWRLLVVDDRYPDPEIGDWLRSMDDPRIVYSRNERNLGAGANFARSMSLAEADWFVMVGCDDLLLPDYVARVKELTAVDGSAGFVHPGVEVIDADGRPVSGLVERAKAHYRPSGRGTRVIDPERMATSLARGDWMYFPAILWRTEVARSIGFRPGFDIVQDLALAFDILIAGHPVVLDDRPVFGYRRHAASLSSVEAVAGSRFDEEAELLRDAAARFDALGWHRAARAARVRFSSRVHAALQLPGAVVSRRSAEARALWHHLVAP